MDVSFPSFPTFGGRLPARSGIGLKPEHFREILETKPDIGFFEIHAENYFIAGGPFHHYLTQIRNLYPLSIHGVGLSIGAAGELNAQHLASLQSLLERYQPQSFSEHLAWSTHQETYLNDLLPVAYNAATLQRVCDHIDQVQEYLGRRMLLENPSTYVEFSSSTMEETAFIGAVVQRTGCGLLLDVNNIHVTCTNHHRDAHQYLSSLPLDKVGEIHLAGFSREVAGADEILIDSHGAPVDPEVWSLYGDTIARTGPVATLLERDNDIPPFEILRDEAHFAETYFRVKQRTAA